MKLVLFSMSLISHFFGMFARPSRLHNTSFFFLIFDIWSLTSWSLCLVSKTTVTKVIQSGAIADPPQLVLNETGMTLQSLESGSLKKVVTETPMIFKVVLFRHHPQPILNVKELFQRSVFQLSTCPPFAAIRFLK